MNILIDDSGKGLLCDFGLSRIKTDATSHTAISTADHPVVMGSRNWMSPERLQGGSLKKPVDIGALSDVEQWQQQYRQLDSKLNAWKFSLPSEHGNLSRLFDANSSSKINCIWIMLHITYHT